VHPYFNVISEQPSTRQITVNLNSSAGQKRFNLTHCRFVAVKFVIVGQESTGKDSVSVSIDHCAFEFLNTFQDIFPRKNIPMKRTINSYSSYQKNYSLDIQLHKKTRSTINICDSSFFGYGLKICNVTKVLMKNCEIQQIGRGAESSVHLQECSNILMSYCNVVNSFTEHTVLIDSAHSCRVSMLDCKVVKCRKIGLKVSLDPYRN
jgi:hypothetical protein